MCILTKIESFPKLGKSYFRPEYVVPNKQLHLHHPVYTITTDGPLVPGQSMKPV